MTQSRLKVFVFEEGYDDLMKIYARVIKIFSVHSSFTTILLFGGVTFIFDCAVAY